MHTHACMHACMHACTCARERTHTHTHTHTHTLTHTHTYTHTYTQKHNYHANIHTHAHTYTLSDLAQARRKPLLRSASTTPAKFSLSLVKKAAANPLFKSPALCHLASSWCLDLCCTRLSPLCVHCCESAGIEGRLQVCTCVLLKTKSKCYARAQHHDQHNCRLTKRKERHSPHLHVPCPSIHTGLLQTHTYQTHKNTWTHTWTHTGGEDFSDDDDGDSVASVEEELRPKVRAALHTHTHTHTHVWNIGFEKDSCF